MTWKPPEPMVTVHRAYTLDQLLAVRQQTIEECAKVCEEEAWRLKEIAVSTNSAATNSKAIQASNLADAIRKLKD